MKLHFRPWILALSVLALLLLKEKLMVEVFESLDAPRVISSKLCFLLMFSWELFSYYGFMAYYDLYLKFVALCANGALLFCIIVVILLEIPTTKINVPMNFHCRLEEDVLNCIYTNLKLLWIVFLIWAKLYFTKKVVCSTSWNIAKTYSEPCQTSKMELFVKTVNSLQPEILF